MALAGWIYVLVNSSMPGLVKVGKTTRDPAQRANELSGVTGIPTPFIVAFQEFFPDCDAAESHIHAELSLSGYREAANREFFRADPSVVVKAVLSIPKDELAEQECVPSILTELPNVREYLFRGLILDDPESSLSSMPWDDVLAQADGNYYGYSDYLQDFGEALELYLKAIQLGSLVAYEQVGIIYERGQGVREDVRESVRYYKEGASRGNFFCYARLGLVFESVQYRHLMNADNAAKCWRQFFRQLSTALDKELATGGDDLWLIFEYVSSRVRENARIEPFIQETIARRAEFVLVILEDVNERVRQDTGGNIVNYHAMRSLLEEAQVSCGRHAT